MATLRGTWRIQTGTYGYTDVRLYADETSVNTSANQSTVSTWLRLYRSAGTWSADSWSCGLNGTADKSGGYISIGAGETEIASGSFTVNHNSDGTASTKVGCWFSSTYGSVSYQEVSFDLSKIARGFTSTPSISLKSRTETTATFNYSTSENMNAFEVYVNGNNYKSHATGWYDNTKSGTFTISALSANTNYSVYVKCNRADTSIQGTSNTVSITTYNYPYVSSMSDFTIGNTCNFTLYNPLGRTCTLYLVSNDTQIADTNTTSGTSCSLWSSESSVNQLYATVPNTASANYYIKVSYGGVTKQSGNKKVSVPSSVVPTVGTITVDEQNTSIPSSYRNNTFRYLSKKKVSVKPTGNKSASISKVTITYGSTTLTATNSNETYSATFSSISSGSFAVTVTDSRGRTSTSSSKQTYYEYTYPTVSVTANRESETSSNGSATVSGKYWNDCSNTVTLYFDRASSASTAVSDATISSGSVSYAKDYDDLYYTSTFNFTAKVVDSFGQTATSKYQLSHGKPTIWLGKNKVIVNDKLEAPIRESRVLSVGDSSNNYVHLLDISIKSSYKNSPIEIKYFSRANESPVRLYIRFSNTSTTDPSLETFYYEYNCKGAWMYKTGTSTWELWIQKSETWDSIGLNEISYNQETMGTDFIDIVGTSQSALPTSYLSMTKAINYRLRDVYPIGSIYLSVSSTSPATLFGGTWEQLKDRFLIGAGSSYSNGSTGGATTHTHSTQAHTLTVNEMPSHQHYSKAYNANNSLYKMAVDSLRLNSNVATWTSAGNTTAGSVDGDRIGKSDPTGGGASHSHGNTGSSSNMPPYLAVYMWKRTA